MFLLFFLVWVIFNGRITLEIAIFGVAIAAVCYWVVCRLFGFSVKKDWLIVKRLFRLLNLGLVLLVEIFKANFQVIRWVYSLDRTAEPEMVQFTVDLKSAVARVMLANCITLTPGTITGILEGNTYVVHCLDKSLAEGLDQSVFVKLLKELEEAGDE